MKTQLDDLPEKIALERVNGVDDAASFCNFNRDTFRKYARDGLVPKPKKLTDHKVGWRLGDLEWLKNRPAA